MNKTIRKNVEEHTLSCMVTAISAAVLTIVCSVIILAKRKRC